MYYRITRFVLSRVKWSIYDLDDAVYISEDSEVVSHFVERVHRVIVGSDRLRTWALTHNSDVEVITTMLPVPEWVPAPNDNLFTVGWIGKFHHHECDLIDVLFPAVRRLSFPMRLRLIGIRPDEQGVIHEHLRGCDHVDVDFVQIEDWTNEGEIQKWLRSFHVGVMPLVESEISESRSAFKLKQYSACGVPSLASPVGETRRFLLEGENGWLCHDEDEWVDHLTRLRGLGKDERDALSKSSYKCAVSGDYNLERCIDRYGHALFGLGEDYEQLEACPVCSSTAWELDYIAEDLLNHFPGCFYLSRCRDCGLRFQNPRITKSSIHCYYPSDAVYYNYAYEDKIGKCTRAWMKYIFGYFPQEKRRWWKMLIVRFACLLLGKPVCPRFISGGEMLELGCGNGTKLLPFRTAGWTVRGYDFQESAIAKGRSHGLNLEVRDLENKALFEPEYGRYDAVILMMVLEHVHDYEQVLDLCSNLLRPGGELMLNVPIYRGSTRWLKSYAYALHLPCHINFFRPQNIRTLLRARGFDNFDLMYEYNRRDFAASYSNFAKAQKSSLWAFFDLVPIRALLAIAYALLARLGVSSRLRVTARKKAD